MERGGEERGEIRDVFGGFGDGGTPLVKEGLDLGGVELGDVVVGAGWDETEDVGERGGFRIVGLEADVGEGEGGVRGGREGGEKGGSPEGRGAEEKRSETEAFEQCPTGE